MTPIENIIRMVESTSDSDSSTDKKIIIVEILKNGEVNVLPKKPFIALGRNIKYYLVSTRNKVVVSDLVCTVSGVGFKLNLLFQYSVKCQNPEKTIKILCGHNNIQNRLDELLNLCIDQYCKNQSINDQGFAFNFYKHKENLEQFIYLEANSKWGLDLQITITPENEKHLKPIHINSNTGSSGGWDVRVKDYEKRLNVSFESQFGIDEENKIKAVLNLNVEQETRAIIKKEMLAYFMNEVSLQEFKENLKSKVKEELTQRINNQCIQYGRRITFINLSTSDSAIQPKEYPIIEHPVVCRIAEYSDSIVVNNEVLISLNNIGLYRTAGIENLEKYIKNILNRVVQDQLFDQTYLEVLLKLDEPKQRIIDEVRKELKKIGYEVKHHMVVPNLAPLKLKDGFKIKKEQIFTTRDSRVPVNLEISLQGKIVDLLNETVKSLIEAKEDVETAIYRKVLEALENQINKLNPDQIFMYFHVSKEVGEDSVDYLLKQCIQKELEGFKILNLNISLKLLENEITRHVSKLINTIKSSKLNSFKVELIPLRGEENVEKVVFEAEYQIIGVHPDGWYTYQTNAINNDKVNVEKQVEAINQTMKRGISETLETFPIEVLRYGEVNVLKNIKIIINKKVNELVAKAYGLNIEVLTFRREATLWEQDRLATNAETAREHFDNNRKAAEIANKNRLKELEILYKSRTELLESDLEAVADELVEIDNKIKEITDQVPTYQIGQTKKNQQQLTAPNKSGEFSFDDYIESSRQIEETKYKEGDEEI